MEVVQFTAEDGDSWWSVVLADGGDIATGVMHATREEAEAELRELENVTHTRLLVIANRGLQSGDFSSGEACFAAADQLKTASGIQGTCVKP